jgi:hypothetical protein
MMRSYCIEEKLSAKVTYAAPPFTFNVVVRETTAGVNELLVGLSEAELEALGFSRPFYEGQVIEVDAEGVRDVSEERRERAKRIYDKLLEREAHHSS